MLFRSGVKVFASDIDPRFLASAAQGTFALSAVGDSLSPEQQAKYFTRSQDALRVKPELRQMVLFARHNLLADPPFTQMDLVTCRNVLIYFVNQGQERVLGSLQFARSGGLRAGALAADALTRLTDSDASPRNIEFRIEGGRDSSGFSVLRIAVTGSLMLICQRCLNELEWPLATDTTLRLVKSQKEIELAEDEVDRVLASRSMDVAQLVEDEIGRAHV